MKTQDNQAVKLTMPISVLIDLMYVLALAEKLDRTGATKRISKWLVDAKKQEESVPVEVREALSRILKRYCYSDICDDALYDIAKEWLDKPFAHRNGETEPPEVPGGYWFRRPGTPPGVFGLVQVWRNGYNGYLYCDKYNEDYNCMDEVPPQDYGENLRWWGPITEPEIIDE